MFVYPQPPRRRVLRPENCRVDQNSQKQQKYRHAIIRPMSFRARNLMGEGLENFMHSPSAMHSQWAAGVDPIPIKVA